MVMALLLSVEVEMGSISDEHVTRRVEDRYRRPRSTRDCLRRHSAGPEDGNLVRIDPNGIAEVGRAEIGDAERCGIADVHRAAVHGGKAAADLDGAWNVGGCKRPHRHHHRALEWPGADTATIRDVH